MMGQITDTFKQKWTDFWVHAINNPKSSIQGASSFVAIVFLGVSEFIPHNKLYFVLVAIAAGLNKMMLGFKQKDPGTEVVTTPTNPTPHPEESTELPVNPTAEVVSK